MTDTYSKIINLLESNNIPYEIIEHIEEGRSKEISLIRGNDPSQAMKALVITVKGGNIEKKNILAVIPGCLRLSAPSLNRLFGSKKTRFSTEEEVYNLTGCVIGGVPPFSFNKSLILVVDNKCGNNEDIIFNAGRLDKSILMNFNDYKCISGAIYSDISLKN